MIIKHSFASYDRLFQWEEEEEEHSSTILFFSLHAENKLSDETLSSKRNDDSVGVEYSVY